MLILSATYKNPGLDSALYIGEHSQTMEMAPGFNSDIVSDGKTFHVQTEDWGDNNPFIVTRVYQSGTVLVSIKTSYENVIQRSFATGRHAISLGMREQHQKVLDQLVSGTLLAVSIR